MTHPCPIPDCPHVVDDDKLMCRGHWRMVPLNLQRAVWSTWRKFKSRFQKGRSVSERLKVLHDFHDARREAISHVVRKLGKPVCRNCGCSERDACPGGCSWTRPDLCSQCAGSDYPQHLLAAGSPEAA